MVLYKTTQQVGQAIVAVRVRKGRCRRCCSGDSERRSASGSLQVRENCFASRIEDLREKTARVEKWIQYLDGRSQCERPLEALGTRSPEWISGHTRCTRDEERVF